MLNRLAISIALVLLSMAFARAENQWYNSTLTPNEIKIDQNSYVSWGKVDNDYLELNLIYENLNGELNFNIDPVAHVNVGLAEATPTGGFYGFEFKAVFQLIINDVVVVLNGNLDQSYIPSDNFRILKCSGELLFFKNGELLYIHCEGLEGKSFKHVTEVFSATNEGRLIATFDSDYDCSLGIVESGGGSVSYRSSERKVKSITTYDILSTLDLKPNSYVILNVFDAYDSPIKQYRKLVGREGVILAIEELKPLFERKKEISIRVSYK